jgi:hypothetical protein
MFENYTGGGEMKTQIIQCADRPRVELHGQQLVITFSDMNNSKCELEINQSQAWCLAQDILETINDYKEW